jgi:hypothetical protein
MHAEQARDDLRLTMRQQRLRPLVQALVGILDRAS